MALESLRSSSFGRGGTGLTDGTLQRVLTELQGLTYSVVSGAAAGTAMNIAALRTEDTILAALVTTDAAASAVVDDKANITIQPTKASGTITCASVADADACVVNGVTYTFKDVPTAQTHIKRTAGDNNANAASLAAAINYYETRRVNSAPNIPAVVATVATNVVTVTSIVDGAGPKVTLAGTPTRLAATNSGTYTATLTAASAVNNDTFAITDLSGTVVTFTLKTAPSASVKTDVGLGVDNASQALKVANAINAYQNATGMIVPAARGALAVSTTGLQLS